MTRASFGDMNCPIARTLEVIGDSWTPLVIRDIAAGITRFDAIQGNLGISRKVLTERLATLVEHGVIQRVAYQDNPTRYDYLLTEKGGGLGFVLVAMQAWGNRWVFDEQPPPVFRHDTCGAVTAPVPTCAACGDPLLPGDITVLPAVAV